MKGKISRIFGEEIIQPEAIQQLKNCLNEEGSVGVLTPDSHKGYSHPIGGAIAYIDKISLSGIGYDIGCGNGAICTNLKYSENSQEVPSWMDEIVSRISFGMGRNNNEKVDHPILDKIGRADLRILSNMHQMASNQLGTVGGGNHFVDLFRDENDLIWIGVHFGSRGFGHKITTGFIGLHQGKKWGDKVSEGPMDGPPVLFSVYKEIGQDYLYAVDLAGEYAYAGREVVLNKVLEILGNPKVLKSVHNHHNFYWREIHNGFPYYVVRKGCTPAFPNQLGFIGSNMLDDSVIVSGIDSEDSKDALYSTVHGAGRVMSRNQAAGKKKWIRNEQGIKVPTLVTKGLVDFNEVQVEMRRRNIELRGAGADEAPQCYKKLSEVLSYQKNNVKIEHVLTPIGVAMAGSEVVDLYKD